MIDLSFLTEEEQEAIMKVLQRDAELKRAEEERVRHLPDKIKDDQQLKNMSGQWFYEAKSKRHRDKIHGADIIRESMRKKKPQIIVEPNQNRTARVKKTWVNNVDRDILLPSELLGEEPEDDVSGLSNSRTVILNPDPYTSDKAQENPRKSSMSSTKLRKNPFNGSMLPEDNLSFEIPNEPSENGQTGLHHTSKEDALFHLKENKSTPYVPKERLEEPRPAVLGSADGSPIKPPIPKARKLTYKNTSDQQPEDNQSHSKMVQRTDSLKSRSAPRGILKRNSSSSSTDSETVRFNHTLEPKSKNLPSKLIIHEGNSEDESIENESSQNPLEPLKHVRFSSVKEEVSQGPELNQGKEVGEFGLLEADISRNGMENSGDFQEFPNKPVFSKFRKPTQQNPAPDSYQSNGFSPSTANTYDQKTHPHSETLTQRLSSSENLSSNKESPKAPSKQLSLESELCANPADECPHWVEPELPQVQDLNNSADHQQGKHIDFKALNAKTSSQYDQRTTEITKATDNSISKVLDWFSRSSNPDAKMPSFLHPQEIQSKGKPGSKWQNNNTMDVENAIPQQNALKSPIFMQGEIKTTENSYPFWGKGDLLSFENGKDSGKDFKKSNGGVLSKQVGKEKEKPSQPLKSQNQGSKRTIPIQDTKNLNEGKETHFLNIDSPLNIFKRLNAECQVASKIEDSSYRNRGNSKTTIDSFENVREPKLKYNMEAESRKVKKDDHLSFPLEGENTKSPTLVASEEFRNKESNFPNQGGLSSPYKKPEGLHQEEASHLPVSQLQRSKYKRVSDRISFWEGEGQTAKLTDKSSNSAGNKVQVSTLGTWPRKSVDLSVGNLTEDQNEYGQIIAKKVDLNKNDQTSHAPRLYSSFKREEFKPKIMGTSQRYTSMYQPGKIPSFQNESISLPMTGNLQFKTNMTFPASKHDSPRNNKVYSCFENDRSSVAQPNPNFKVWSLKERMNENFPKQVNNPLQFQTLRNFWDMGTHSDSMNSSTLPSSKSSLPLNNQKHKEFDEAELKEESALAEQNLLRQNKALHGEEIGKWDSKLIPQTLSDEATFPSKSPVESIQLTRNVPSKENVNEHLDMLISPKLKEDHISREEVKESVVKTNVSPKKYQDHFNRSLKKLLEETPSLSFPPVHDKGSSGNANEPNFSESRTRLQETDLADFEERAESPQQDPKTSKTNTLDPPEVKYKSHISSSEKALKEQPELPDSSNQVKSETVSTGTRSLSKQRRFFEKVMERSCNNSFYKWEVGIPLGEVEDASNNTVVPPKVKSGDYEISQEKLFQRVPALSPSLYQTADLIKKESLEEAANSSQKMSTFHSTYAAIQDKQEPPQMEISETIEKTILPKTELNDLNIALERLHREAQEDELNSLRKKAVSREGKPEFPEGVAITHNQINSSVCMAGESVAPDEKSSQPIDTSLEEPGEEALIICSENSLDSPYLGTPLTQPGSTSCQDSKELPQEISETVTKTIVQSRAELREFHFRTEKLLKESSKSSFLKQGNDIIKNSQSELIDKSALPHQTAASEIQHSDFLEKIKETIEKSLAPSVVESAFDIGFKKILRELSISLPTGTLEKETIRTEDLPSELGKLSRKMTHLDSGSQRDAKAKKAKKVKGEVLKPESQEFEDKANVSEEGRPQVSESRIHIPEILPVHMSPEIGKNEIRDNFIDNGTSDDAYGTTREENFQITNESLPRKKRHSKMSRIELFLASPYKRGEEERESFSGSDVSDEYVGSNTDSQRSSSRSEDESKAVLKALKRDADRKIPSQSLEDIPSDTSNQGKVDSLPEDLVRSAEDDQKTDQQTTNEYIPEISTVPSHPDNQFAHPEKLKRMSKSVPAFLQDESDDRETDTASESSYQLGRHKKSPSSLTNLSSSSGMTSLSSVSGSAMSVYSGDFGNLDIKGSVQFAIDYIDSLMEFHVFVAQCKDLAAADVKKQRSDPYVKTYLLPDKGKMGKKKTLVMKKTLNPVYNEILRYKIDKQSLKNQKLNLSVWHRDTFKRNSFLGEVELDLETWDWDNKQNKQLKWYPLNRRTAPVALEAENRGEMKLALQYVPDPVSGKKPATTGEVHIWVKECIDLPHLRGNHLNSFVKCTILPDTSRKSRQKTRAVGKTNNPIFNHTMVYDGFRPEDLKEACVELTVWDHHKLTNQFLGGLRIGFGTGKSYEIEVDWMDSTPAEISLWERMVNSPNTWIEDILPLRMLLIAKLTK